jgi:hypothetical protein
MFIRLIAVSMIFLSLNAQEATKTLSSIQLITAHSKALQHYHNNNTQHQYERINNALKEFSSFDLQNLAKPANLTNQ